jgi:ATP synthase protein I
MTIIASSPQTDLRRNEAGVADEALETEFKPLTADEAKAWRQSHPQSSPWRVLWLQAGVGTLVALLTAWVTGQAHLAASVAWGALAVVIPAIVFVRALSRQMRRIPSGSALVGLLVWELVKIILTVALLLVAPKVISDLNWFAFVAGFVVTMKVYWLAMALGWMQRKSKPTIF